VHGQEHSLGSEHYSIAQVSELARQGRVIATRRVTQWLTNHGYPAKETLMDVLTSLESDGQFVSSCTLKNDAVADEYVVSLDEDDWYVKFWVDADQLVVDVWSCCWDGAVH
jgi:hypothetical protein